MRDPCPRRRPADLSDAEGTASEPSLPPPAARRRAPAHARPVAGARARGGRPPAEPSAAAVDGQTARAMGVGGPARGCGAAKRTAGRKRRIPADTAGPAPLAHVRAADLRDRLGAKALIHRAGVGDLPRLELVWADGAHAGTFARWLEAERGRRAEAPERRDRHLRRHGLEGKPRELSGHPAKVGGGTNLRVAAAPAQAGARP